MKSRLTIASSLGAALIALMLLPGWGGKGEHHVSNRLGAKLQQVLDSAVANPRTVIPGTALYISQPNLGSWAGAAGQANIDPSAPMRANDTFRAGSIVKPFVSAVVLQLVEEKKLTLDDRLSTVLPHGVVARFPNADQITIRICSTTRAASRTTSTARSTVMYSPTRNESGRSRSSSTARRRNGRSSRPARDTDTRTRTTTCSDSSSSAQPASRGERPSASASSTAWA